MPPAPKTPVQSVYDEMDDFTSRYLVTPINIPMVKRTRDETTETTQGISAVTYGNKKARARRGPRAL